MLTELNERLTKWREERHLDRKGQQDGLMPNLLEELTEYSRATNAYERVDALCDISVFLMNAYEIDINPSDYNAILKDRDFVTLYRLEILIELISNFGWQRGLQEDEKNAYLSRLFIAIIKLMEYEGYDWLSCMDETLKEISSRTGHWDDKINKFVKDKDAKTYKADYSKGKIQ